LTEFSPEMPKEVDELVKNWDKAVGRWKLD
jgi:hypothetical protein